MPITRSDVHSWVAAWKKSRSKKKGTLEEWVTAKVEALSLSDPMVNTTGHAGRGDETHVAVLLLDDLRSYVAHR